MKSAAIPANLEGNSATIRWIAAFIFVLSVHLTIVFLLLRKPIPISQPVQETAVLVDLQPVDVAASAEQQDQEQATEQEKVAPADQPPIPPTDQAPPPPKTQPLQSDVQAPPPETAPSPPSIQQPLDVPPARPEIALSPAAGASKPLPKPRPPPARQKPPGMQKMRPSPPVPPQEHASPNVTRAPQVSHYPNGAASAGASAPGSTNYRALVIAEM